MSEKISLSLKISSSFKNQKWAGAYVKLLAKISERHISTLNLRNFDHICVQSSKTYVAASVQFVDNLADDLIILTPQLEEELEVGELETVTVSTISENIPDATSVQFILENGPKPKNEINILPHIMFRPVKPGLKLKIGEHVFKINSIAPESKYAIIHRQTKIEISENFVESLDFQQIGGLDVEIKRIKELIQYPLIYPHFFKKINVEPPKGILLHGPPGVGKTMLAKAIAKSINATFLFLNAPDITSKYYGESEKKLHNLFNQAKQNPPALIFIDEIDAIAPKREKSTEVDKRIVTKLLTLMDGFESSSKIIVIAATNLPNSLDEAIRRPGRFDIELSISPPNEVGRLNILKTKLRKVAKEPNLNLAYLAKKTHGFTGADLDLLIKEACLERVSEEIKALKLNPDYSPNLKIADYNLSSALSLVKPSLLRTYHVQKSETTWSDLIGLNQEITEIKQALEIPLRNAELFEKYSFKTIRGILLHGPPGVGKTMLAKAIANELDYNYILVRGPELLSELVGRTEENIRTIFKKARETSPTLIIMDEIDSLFQNRRGDSANDHINSQIMGQLLTELDGLENLEKVLVIGTTNRPDLIDKALIRPGRFDKKILINKPTESAMRDLYFKYLSKIPHEISEIHMADIVYTSYHNHFTGADISAVVRDAFTNNVSLLEEQKVDKILLTKNLLWGALQNHLIQSDSLTSHNHSINAN